MDRFRLTPLPAPLAESPTALTQVASEPHAFPCRRCLTDAAPGELLVLTSYDPFLGTSPYRGAGPIFVHERACEYRPEGAVPEQLRRRLLALRGYDRDHMMVASDVVDGDDFEKGVGAMLDDEAVDYVHVHFARPGCFAVRVDPL